MDRTSNYDAHKMQAAVRHHRKMGKTDEEIVTHFRTKGEWLLQIAESLECDIAVRCECRQGHGLCKWCHTNQ